MSLEDGEPGVGSSLLQDSSARMASKHWCPIKDTSWCAPELPVKSLLANTTVCKLLELIPPSLPEPSRGDLSLWPLGRRATR